MVSPFSSHSTQTRPSKIPNVPLGANILPVMVLVVTPLPASGLPEEEPPRPASTRPASNPPLLPDPLEDAVSPEDVDVAVHAATAVNNRQDAIKGRMVPAA